MPHTLSSLNRLSRSQLRVGLHCLDPSVSGPEWRLHTLESIKLQVRIITRMLILESPIPEVRQDRFVRFEKTIFEKCNRLSILYQYVSTERGSLNLLPDAAEC